MENQSIELIYLFFITQIKEFFFLTVAPALRQFSNPL